MIFDKTPSTSVLVAADKLKISKSSVARMKRNDLGLKAYMKQLSHKYIKNQEERAKRGCRRVHNSQLRKVLVIDHETYVPSDPNDVPGKQYFDSTSRNFVTYDQKIVPKANFFHEIFRMADYRRIWLCLPAIHFVSLYERKSVSE